MEHPMINNYMKALYISVNPVAPEKSTISLQGFLSMSYVLQQFDFPHVYRAAFALSFFDPRDAIKCGIHHGGQFFVNSVWCRKWHHNFPVYFRWNMEHTTEKQLAGVELHRQYLRSLGSRHQLSQVQIHV